MIVVEKSERNYSAYAPDLPGCIVTGPTVEETVRLMREAIEFHIEGLRAEGLNVPQPSTVSEYVEVQA
jgi:predicted RNase H-like HicB family nuclease